MHIYKIKFIVIFIINMLNASNTIEFSSLDSLYINRFLDSLVNNNSELHLEYRIKDYNIDSSQIVYETISVPKEIDTVFFKVEKGYTTNITKNISKRFNRYVIDENFISKIDKNRNQILNNFYFITEKPKVDIGIYDKDKIGMVFYLNPIFNSYISGLVGISKSVNQDALLKGELDFRLENLWGRMESISFFWRKNDSLNQSMKLNIALPNFYGFRYNIISNFHYELINGLFTETDFDVISDISSQYFGRFSLGYNKGKLIPTSNGYKSNYYKSNYESLLFIFNKNSLNRRLLPYKGTKMFYKFQLGNNQSNNGAFLKQIVEIEHYINYRPQLNIFLKSNTNFIKSINGTLNPLMYLRYGGINSLRGYYDNQFKSNSFSIETFELQYQKSPLLRLSVFCDLMLKKYSIDKMGYGIGISKVSKNSFYEIQYAIPIELSPFEGKIHFKLSSRL